MKFSNDLYVLNFRTVRRFAAIVGMDLVNPDYKPNLLTLLTCCLTLTTFISEFYTVWFYWNDLVKLMESAAIFGVFIQGCTKIYTGIRYHKFYLSMYDRLDKLHSENWGHEKNNASLRVLMERIILLRKLVTLQFSFLTLALGMVPIIVYMFEGERILPYNILLPFTDPSNTKHFLLNLAIQSLLMLLGCFGFIASESAIILFVTSVAGYADVLTNMVDELNAMLLEAEVMKNRIQIGRKLHAIVSLHQQLLEYEMDLKEVYYVNNMVQIFSSVFNLTGAIFGCFVSSSLTMYAIAITIVVQLFELCLLGTILSVKNQQIHGAFNNVLWYLMDRPEKRTFIIMLHKSQHAVEMTVANMAPLNIALYISIMRKIYGFSMMLMNFLE